MKPARLLMDDMRSAVQANSLLGLIGSGYHRLSELAGRVGQPATNLSRPLSRLIDLGYVRREVPFGESTRSTRRSLYRLDDPFLLFWYRFVAPNRSRLEIDLIDPVHTEVQARLAGHVAEVWEWLARRSVPHVTIDDLHWDRASRWWGTGTGGEPLEIDVVAESSDRRHLLLGESEVVRPRRPGRHTRRAGSQGPAHPVPPRSPDALRALVETRCRRPGRRGDDRHAGEGDVGILRGVTWALAPRQSPGGMRAADRSDPGSPAQPARPPLPLPPPTRPTARSRRRRA